MHVLPLCASARLLKVGYLPMCMRKYLIFAYVCVHGLPKSKNLNRYQCVQEGSLPPVNRHYTSGLWYFHSIKGSLQKGEQVNKQEIIEQISQYHNAGIILVIMNTCFSQSCRSNTSARMLLFIQASWALLVSFKLTLSCFFGWSYCNELSRLVVNVNAVNKEVGSQLMDDNSLICLINKRLVTLNMKAMFAEVWSLAKPQYVLVNELNIPRCKTLNSIIDRYHLHPVFTIIMNHDQPTLIMAETKSLKPPPALRRCADFGGYLLIWLWSTPIPWASWISQRVGPTPLPSLAWAAIDANQPQNQWGICTNNLP